MYRVLLVDDEVLVREAISENIRWNELGYQLAGCCQNGKEAMEFMEKHAVDLVLTDICMPYMDGMELSEFIYNNFPETNIIIFSGFDDFEYAKKAIKYNVEEYLLKPVTAFELSEVLTNLKERMDKKRQTELKLDRLNETYNKNKIFIFSKVLADFIMGIKTEEENNKALREANIALNASGFCVAIVEIDLYADLYNADEKTKQQSALMAFAVYNIVDEIVNQYQAGVACQGNNYRVFVLFETSKLKEIESEILPICKEISDKVMQFMQLGVTIGIGRAVKKQNEIHRSYEEAQDAIHYRYLFGESSIINMEEIIRKGNMNIVIEPTVEDLIMAIKLHDKNKMDQDFEKIEETIKESLLDKSRSSLSLQQVILAVSDVLRASDLIDSPIYVSKNQLLSDIAVSKTLKEAMEKLKHYCRQVAEELDLQKNSGGKKHALLAMDYIEKNYGNSELNLNSVCSYLSISPSRFSTIFKNATGETFMEVLIRIRMEKAKELLENTDLKNYEIAEKVGLSDPHYFSIVFKKMTGKTPTEYAKEKR